MPELEFESMRLPTYFSLYCYALCAHPMEEEDWWLYLYVMLSRATSLDDLLLLRAPDADFLLRGPPADLRVRLAIFARRVRATRTRAEALARSFGFEAFLR